MKILKLTYNEIIKQVKKRSFIISLIILLVFSSLIPVIYKSLIYKDNTNINKEYIVENIITKEEYKKIDTNISYEEYVKLINIKNKQIEKENKEKTNNDNNIIIKETFNNTVEVNIAIISIIMVIISGSIISSEFQKGTIKTLITKPAKRWKILISKLISIIIIIISLSFISYVFSFITSLILFKFNNYLIYNLINSFYHMLLLLIPIIFISILSLFLSVITSNTAFSVAISIVLLLSSELILLFLPLIDFPYTNLTFLPYLDFAQFINKIKLVDNCFMFDIYYTFKHAIIVLITWSLVLYLISNIIFINKDIKNI